METWTFMDFLEADASNTILAWLNSLRLDRGREPRAKVKINTRIQYLEALENWDWPPHMIARLACYDEIYELRVVHKNIQYRPLGCYGPGQREFTLLVGAREENDDFRPREAPRIAKERRNIILRDR